MLAAFSHGILLHIPRKIPYHRQSCQGLDEHRGRPLGSHHAAAHRSNARRELPRSHVKPKDIPLPLPKTTGEMFRPTACSMYKRRSSADNSRNASFMPPLPGELAADRVQPCRAKPQVLAEFPPLVGMWPPQKNFKNFPKSLSEQIATPVNNEEM